MAGVCAQVGGESEVGGLCFFLSFVFSNELHQMGSSGTIMLGEEEDDRGEQRASMVGGIGGGVGLGKRG